MHVHSYFLSQSGCARVVNLLHISNCLRRFRAFRELRSSERRSKDFGNSCNMGALLLLHERKTLARVGCPPERVYGSSGGLPNCHSLRRAGRITLVNRQQAVKRHWCASRTIQIRPLGASASALAVAQELSSDPLWEDRPALLHSLATTNERLSPPRTEGVDLVRCRSFQS